MFERSKSQIYRVAVFLAVLASLSFTMACGGGTSNTGSNNNNSDSGGGTSTLTVMVTTSGGSSVTGNNGGINCTTNCNYTFNNGQLVTLSAVPGSGPAFAGWSGAGCNGTATCAITMNGNASVTATFSTTSTSNWVLNTSSSCAYPVTFQLFDTTAHLDYPQVTALPGVQNGPTAITCTTGHQICYGAASQGTNTTWGVSLDDNQQCTNCCASCSDTPTYTESVGPGPNGSC